MSEMKALWTAALLSLLHLASGQDGVVFAAIKEDQHLTTRLGCRVEEEEHFVYSSAVELWGAGGGRILVQADVLTRCLGADVGGKYGNHALKYSVHISDLRMTTQDDSVSPRERRGAREFLSSSWRRVKQFFRRMFGGKKEEGMPRTPDIRGDDPEPEEASHEGAYSVPFQMLQLADGSIPELRFSENEVEEGRVRNFKRHLADAFSTHLSHSATVLESTVMGEHTATYNVTITGEASNLNVAGWTGEEEVVVVEKRVTEEDIVELAPSEALNDRDKMSLKTLQTQVFKHGRLVSSSGSSSFNLLTEDTEKNRDKREADEENLYMRAHTSFVIQSRRRRRRRSVEESRPFQGEEFRPVSRVAESEGESEERKELQRLHEAANFSAIVDDLWNEATKEGDILQSLSGVLEREARLRLDGERDSLSSAIRRTLPKIEEMCGGRNFSHCKGHLRLLALTGGPKVDRVFQRLFKEVEVEQLLPLCDILEDLSRPSAQLLRMIGDVLVQRPEVRGALVICLSNLASTSGEEGIAARTLLSLLEGCGPDTIDLLEAAGNLKSDSGLISRVMQISESCADEVTVQIGCVHALRHSSHLSSVQNWMERLARKGDCDVINEVVGALLDNVEQRGAPQWAEVLLEKEQERCSSKDVLRYFRHKKELTRSRRDLWDDFHCEEWTADSRYEPVQGRDEFAVDRATYNKRKSCLAYRTVGVKKANAEIYAGMFAGLKEPSDPPKYKLFTKFVASLNVLGYRSEVGSFYFYLHSGQIKAYVRVLGKTRQEFVNEGCTPTELKYRPLKHVPLYRVSIANLQISLGLQLSGRLSLDTTCPTSGVLLLRPLVHVRAGSEAHGSVLFVRGVASLGADFNYNLQFTFTPSPNMCLNGSHGYDPMNVNFESYFQLWNTVKEEWGKVRTWKPNFTFWRIREGKTKSWFKETCISPEEEVPPGREME